MTGTELKSTVASLGFRSELPDIQLFYSCANIAIAELNKLRPYTKELCVKVTGGEQLDIPSLTHTDSFLQIAYTDIIPEGYLSSQAAPFTVNRSVITVSPGFRGTLKIGYYSAPTPLDADTVDEQIKIDPMLTEMLPILTASYVWRDEEPEKAAEYRAEYESSKKHIPAPYTCNRVFTNGW